MPDPVYLLAAFVLGVLLGLFYFLASIQVLQGLFYRDQETLAYLKSRVIIVVSLVATATAVVLAIHFVFR